MITAIDKNTALVLIDLQKGIAQAPKAHNVDEILERSAELLHAFHKSALPVVIVNVSPAGAWLKSRKDAVPPAIPPADDWLEIVPELHTRPDDIFITKHTWNAFFDTQLHQTLQERSITHIVFAGIATSIGIEGSARSASEYGYNISFASDAMTDGFLEAHERSMKYIFPRIGEIGTTAEIIEKIPGAQD